MRGDEAGFGAGHLSPGSCPRPPRMEMPPITAAAIDWKRYGSPIPSVGCPE